MDAAPGGPVRDVQTLHMASDTLALQLLPELEDGVHKCSEQLAHLLGSLQSSLHATTQISLRYYETMHAAVDDLHLAVGASVVLMNQLVAKVQEVNADMKPVDDIAAQIKDISRTLALLEAGVARLATKRGAV